MEILALYESSENLGTAVAAGARHLAATIDGFALVYSESSPSGEPDGWAGFSCAGDAQVAGDKLEGFRIQTAAAERPLRCDPPLEPQRIWSRGSGGVFGFPLRHGGRTRGVAIVGCPGAWPRMRNAEVESILRQVTLVLDHHAVTAEDASTEEPSDEVLRLSEQLLAQDIELIKREERIDQIEQVKNDLIEKMSYELRMPLNGIIERIISVLAAEHENLADAGRRALRESLDEGNALLRTLQNILDLWRIKQNAIRVEIQDVNLSEVVEEAIFNVRDSLQPDVTLEKRMAHALPKVRTDLAKLNQVLFHLLDNAAKFTRRGRIELEISFEEGQLLCSVADSGIGISNEDKTLVFDEFFQVDPDSGRSGAGLGLTVTRALVEQLGGAISLSSEVGQGSRFSFTLPVTTG
jgi:signal transduction histidine kinase